MSATELEELVRPIKLLPPNKSATTKYQQLCAYLANHWALTIAVFLISVAVMVAYKPFQQLELGDQALYDYFAQTILRGLTPYRDAVDGKAPGSMYLSALAMLAGKSVGIRDIFAVRLFNILLVGLLSSLTYVVGFSYLGSRAAALLGALFPLRFPAYAILMIGGTQPKLPMILFGMVTLLFLIREQPFWAGFFSMLAALCWQPGLLFTGVAVLMFSKYLTLWQDGRALKVMLGAGVPLAITLFYFSFNAALADLWNWTIVYNYSFYAPKINRSLASALWHIWEVTMITLKGHAFYLLMSAVGSLLFLSKRVRQKFDKSDNDKLGEPYRDAFVLIPLLYLAFCVAHFLGDDDLIPLFPFIGLFIGWFLVAMTQHLAASRLGQLRLPWLHWVRFVPAGALLLLLLATYIQVKKYNRQPGIPLRSQEAAFQKVADLLTANDKIYVHRGLELLVFLNRPNASKYIILDRGKDDFIEAKLAGGFQAVMDDLQAQSPKIILISHLGQLSSSHRATIRQWVEENYEDLSLDPEFELLLPGFDHLYIRKP